MNTMGIVAVADFAARAAGSRAATITLTLRPTRSAASAGSRASPDSIGEQLLPGEDVVGEPVMHSTDEN